MKETQEKNIEILYAIITVLLNIPGVSSADIYKIQSKIDELERLNK